jgi:uncharacterized membrane protein YfcA
MALGIWLYVLPPSLAVPLVLICSVIAQTSTLPSMWKSFDLSLVWPFLIGGLIGVPLGTMLIASADPKVFKLSVGVLILIFSTALYLNKRPPRRDVRWPHCRRRDRLCRRHSRRPRRIVRAAADPLGNIRGWNKHERRGIFQLFNFTVLATALVLQTASGLVEFKVVWLALVAFPGTLIGAWAGARVYHALNDKHFGDVVLGLLFLSGLTLVWNSLAAL